MRRILASQTNHIFIFSARGNLLNNDFSLQIMQTAHPTGKAFQGHIAQSALDTRLPEQSNWLCMIAVTLSRGSTALSRTLAAFQFLNPIH
jgi:hypothetical protein